MNCRYGMISRSELVSYIMIFLNQIKYLFIYIFVYYQIFKQHDVTCRYGMISRSELVSYIMIFLNQIKSASLLSLPLPIMVFMWGTLSTPRPSKNFWIFVIGYTEVCKIVLYLFQNSNNYVS